MSAHSAAKNLPGLLISNNTNYVMRSCLSLNARSVRNGSSHEKVGSSTNKLFIKISSSRCWPLNYMMNNKREKKYYLYIFKAAAAVVKLNSWLFFLFSHFGLQTHFTQIETAHRVHADFVKSMLVIELHKRDKIILSL